MTGSLFLNTLFKLYKILNAYYENSGSYRLVKKLTTLCQNSFFAMGFMKFFTVRDKREYVAGSLFLGAFHNVFIAMIKFFTAIYAFFSNLNAGGVNHTAFTKFILPLNNIGQAISAFSYVMIGFLAARGLYLSFILVDTTQKTLLLNICFLIVFVFISFFSSQTITNMMNGSLFKRFVLWFFQD